MNPFYSFFHSIPCMSTKSLHKNSNSTKINLPKPRWKNRLQKGVQRATLATALTLSALGLSSCAGKLKVEPVVPRPPHNIYCEPGIGTVFVRPDGGDAILSNPSFCGDGFCDYTIPLVAWAVSYGPEYAPARPK